MIDERIYVPINIKKALIVDSRILRALRTDLPIPILQIILTQGGIPVITEVEALEIEAEANIVDIQSTLIIMRVLGDRHKIGVITEVIVTKGMITSQEHRSIHTIGSYPSKKMAHGMFTMIHICMTTEKKICVLGLHTTIIRVTRVYPTIRIFQRPIQEYPRIPERNKAPERSGGFQGKKKKNVMVTGIFNSSTVILTDAEKSVLDKRLEYVPPKQFNTFSMFIDVQMFTRKLSIQ